jgi:secreted trypsin-like serine protease
MRCKALLVAGALFFTGRGASALVGASEPAEAKAAASVVMVHKRGTTGAGYCTGVALTRTAVLTAGHCVSGARSIAINVGAFGAPKRIPVSDVSLHPEYVANAARKRLRSIDLAIVRLAEPLPMSVASAQLDTTGLVTNKQQFTITGFGLTRERDEGSAGRLRSGTLEAREPLSKILLWARDPRGKGFGACTGDSGGPIFAADGSVMAITTWSTGEGSRRCGGITQGALVAPQRRWIERVLREGQ